MASLPGSIKATRYGIVVRHQCRWDMLVHRHCLADGGWRGADQRDSAVSSRPPREAGVRSGGSTAARPRTFPSVSAGMIPLIFATEHHGLSGDGCELSGPQTPNGSGTWRVVRLVKHRSLTSSTSSLVIGFAFFTPWWYSSSSRSRNPCSGRGVRAGRSPRQNTAAYLQKSLSRITFVGALFLRALWRSCRFIATGLSGRIAAQCHVDADRGWV